MADHPVFVPDPEKPIDPRYAMTVWDLHQVLTQAWPDLEWQVQAQAQDDGSCMVGAARKHGDGWWGFAAHIEPCGEGCPIDHDGDPEFRATVVTRVARRLAYDIVSMN